MPDKGGRRLASRAAKRVYGLSRPSPFEGAKSLTVSIRMNNNEPGCRHRAAP